MHDRGLPIQTQSGRAWYAYDPRPEDVFWQDLLSQKNVCRFGGHVRDASCWYSNLEHGLRVGWLLESYGSASPIVLEGLAHDLHEAYPPHDQLGPILMVESPFATEARALSRRAAIAVRTALGLPDRLSRSVKIADNIMLATERRDLMAPSHYDWLPLPEPHPTRIVPREREIVELLFVEMWKKHGGKIP